MSAYYNEFDPFTAAWLRELIKAGLIADGEVDERSITDVQPDDVRGFTQCHFFAGVGGWSYALRLAGWPDDRSVWTGSCPCQPFSAAGKGGGVADERHLWPAFHWLIEQCRPRVVFGEQVESPAGRAWFDLVSTDLEAAGYACGAVDVPAAGIGAPHIRQRLFWVADTEHTERGAVGVHRDDGCNGTDHGREKAHGESGTRSEVCGVADTASEQCDTGWERTAGDEPGPVERPARLCVDDRLAHPSRRGQRIDGGASGDPGHTHQCGSVERVVDGLIARLEGHGGDGDSGVESRRLPSDAARSIAASGATRGAWAAADWLYCRDEKFRPVEPGAFPLGHGFSARVGRLRGYGNAIVPQVAQAFIEAYLEATA